MDYSKIVIPNMEYTKGNCSDCNTTGSLRLVYFYDKKNDCMERDYIVCINCLKETTCN